MPDSLKNALAEIVTCNTLGECEIRVTQLAAPSNVGRDWHVHTSWLDQEPKVIELVESSTPPTVQAVPTRTGAIVRLLNPEAMGINLPELTDSLARITECGDQTYVAMVFYQKPGTKRAHRGPWHLHVNHFSLGHVDLVCS